MSMTHRMSSRTSRRSKVDDIILQVEDLRAHVSLQAEVLDLLKLNVGVDATLGRVQLNIKGVEAQAQLRVRLDEVGPIIARVLDSVDRNPQILEQVTRGVGQAASDLGRGVGDAVDQVGEGAGEAVREVGQGAAAATQQLGRSVGGAVEDIGDGAGVRDRGGGPQCGADGRRRRAARPAMPSAR